MPPPVRLVATGHPDVTGRHAKTLELTAAPGITARASCVLGVGAGPLPGGLTGLRGRVRLDIVAGDLGASVEGEVNPGYASAAHLIVRRSDVLDPDTFLVNASAAAADLDRALVARLRDPATLVSITATELGEPDPLLVLLLAGEPPPAAVAALVASADVVLDLTGPGSPSPPVPLPGARRHAVPADLTGARTVVLLAAGAEAVPAGPLAAALPRRRAVCWPPAYPGAELLLAAGAPTVPVLLGGPLPTAGTARQELAATAAAGPAAVVLTVPSTGPRGRDATGDEAAALAGVRMLLPEHAVLLPDPAVGWGTGAIRLAAGEPLDPAGLAGLRRSPALALLPPPGRRPLGTDPDTLARLLRAAGVSGRTAADLLTALGVPRKEAYRTATASR